MKILVTGGAGYIGSILVPTLLAQGHDVTVLDLFENMDGNTLADCCQYEGFTPIKGDARNEANLDRLVPQHDAIIPLAALVGAPLCKQDPLGAKSLNYGAIKGIVDRSSKDQLIIYPTTNSGLWYWWAG